MKFSAKPKYGCVFEVQNEFNLSLPVEYIFFLPSSRGSKLLERGVETSFSTLPCFFSPVSFLINGARASKKRGAFLPWPGEEKVGLGLHDVFSPLGFLFFRS